MDATPAVEPDEDEQLITIEQAKSYFAQVLDLTMLESGDQGEDQTDVDDSPSGPGDATPIAPAPTSIDEDAAPAAPAGEPEAASPSGGQAGGMRVGPRETVNA